MAKWSISANKSMELFKDQVAPGDLQKLRNEISAWADMIGTRRAKEFTAGRLVYEAVVENHEVISVITKGFA